MVNEGYDRYIGKQVRSYTILQELGSGGSAHVYLALSCLNEPVAIKLLDSVYGNSEKQQLFLQEARFLQELQPHLHILPLLEYGKIEGIPYLVTEYASGGTLRTYINACHSVSIEKALAIVMQLGEAIHTAHQHHIAHCDIKPENVLFNDTGDAILADFGIAVRLGANETFSGPARGTYAYMAPEQFDGMFTKEGDQYALGCIAYELLTGKHPFEHFLPFDPLNRELMKQRHQSAKLLSLKELNSAVPFHVEQAILRSMAKNASNRHPSIASFIYLLQSPAPSSSFLSNYSANPLDVLSLGPYDTEAVLSPMTDPSRNPAPSSAKVAVAYKLNESEKVCSKGTHKAFCDNLPVLSFPNNLNKDRKVNKERQLYTEPPSLPADTSKIHSKDRQSGKRSSQKGLDDLRLCQNSDLFDKLFSLLKDFQLSLTDCTLEDDYLTGVKRKCTSIYSQKSKCEVPNLYLFYIPYRYLTTREENIRNLHYLGSTIPKEATYIIFSDRNNTLELKIDAIINDKWKDDKRYAEFIPPNHLKELQDMPEAAKRKWLTDKLHLKGELEEEKTSKSVQFMEGNEVEDLVKIICDYCKEYIYKGVEGWHSLLSSAGLDSLNSKVNLSGASETVARELIHYLKDCRPLLAEPQYEVLGKLLLRLLQEPLPECAYKSICTIINKYKLMPDSETLPERKT